MKGFDTGYDKEKMMSNSFTEESAAAFDDCMLDTKLDGVLKWMSIDEHYKETERGRDMSKLLNPEATEKQCKDHFYTMVVAGEADEGTEQAHRAGFYKAKYALLWAEYQSVLMYRKLKG